MCRCSAISWLVRPWPTRVSTSRSRPVTLVSSGAGMCPGRGRRANLLIRLRGAVGARGASPGAPPPAGGRQESLPGRDHPDGVQQVGGWGVFEQESARSGPERRIDIFVGPIDIHAVTLWSWPTLPSSNRAAGLIALLLLGAGCVVITHARARDHYADSE